MEQSRLLLQGVPCIPVQAPLAELFEISGALLLQQIHFKVTSHENWQEGHRWFFHTYEEWARELKVLAAETIRKKVKQLETLGVLICGNFNKRKGDRTRWYRIDHARLCEVLQAKLGGIWSPLPDPTGIQYHTPPVFSTAPLHKNEPYKNEDKNTYSAVDTALAEHASLNEDFSGKDEQPNSPTPQSPPPAAPSTFKGTAMATSDQILPKFMQNNKPTGPVKNAKGLSIRWCATVGSHDKFCKPLTLKELSQLAHVAKELGYPRVTNTMEWALDHWTKFAQRVQYAKGVAKPAMEPAVWFFSTYYDVAVQLIAEEEAAQKQAPQAPAQPVITALPKVVEKPVEELAGDAEVDIGMALLKLQGEHPELSVDELMAKYDEMVAKAKGDQT